MKTSVDSMLDDLLASGLSTSGMRQYEARLTAKRWIEDAVAEAVAVERRNIAAYMLDRADQYGTDSGSWCGLVDVCALVMAGESEEAAKCGELDDVYGRVDSMKVRADAIRARVAK